MRELLIPQTEQAAVKRAGAGDLSVPITHEPALQELTNAQRTYNASADTGNDALAHPASVRQLSSRRVVSVLHIITPCRVLERPNTIGLTEQAPVCQTI